MAGELAFLASRTCAAVVLLAACGNYNGRFNMKTCIMTVFIMSVLVLLLLPSRTLGQAQRWSEAQANASYAQQPWFVGSDYLPTNAISQLERKSPFWKDITAQ